MIPKIIHYCWFGGKEKGELISNCIKSWENFLPSYELIEWNEDNYFSDSFFYNYCITNKHYAFASDFARIDILYNKGGIYLDTDMLILKSLDELLDNDLFFGLESPEDISCGIIGAKPNNKELNGILEYLWKVKSAVFFEDYNIVKVVTALFKKIGFDVKVGIQNELRLYPIEYFYAFPYKSKENPLLFKTNDSFALHLWNESWEPKIAKAKKAIEKKQICKGWFLFFNAVFEKPRNIKQIGIIIRLTSSTFKTRN